MNVKVYESIPGEMDQQKIDTYTKNGRFIISI